MILKPHIIAGFFQVLSSLLPSSVLAQSLPGNGTSTNGTNTTTSSLNPQFFTQNLDHSGLSNDTFEQQFQLVTDFFKPGGPIFLFQGEEATDMIRIETTILYTWAQEVGGIAATIEHRYFGKSLPFGNDSWTRENIKYLTLDNTMSDAVAFVNSIKANVSGAENSPVIVASGSYGAFLTTAFRMNHPDTFFGALSSATPVQLRNGNGTLAENPTKFQWWDWVSNVYSDRSAEAAGKIKDAFIALEERFQSNNNLAGLKEELGLCTAPQSPSEFSLVSLFFEFGYMLGAEYNYPVPQPGRSSVALPLELMINASLAQTDSPIQVLNASGWALFGPAGLECLNYTDGSTSAGNNNVHAVVPLIQNLPFSYITCTTVPLLSSDISNNLFLPASQSDINTAFAATCQQTWGITPPSGDEIRAKYHLTDEELSNSTRIIFAKGQYDPTSAVGPGLPMKLTADRNASKVLYVSDMAHREDLFGPVMEDRVTTIQARQIELETFKEWMGMV